MYALAFDLEKAQLIAHFSATSPNNAYKVIRGVLEARGFAWVQGSLYTVASDDMSVLFQAIRDLMALAWFPVCVRDIRGFRVEQWSNFTPMFRGGGSAGGGPGAGGGGAPPP